MIYKEKSKSDNAKYQKIQATLNNNLTVKHYKTPYNHMIKEKLHQK